MVAEDITSRFLNVVSLFNGMVPFVALQMQALKVGEHVTVVFTTVVDELPRGMVDEDEDAEAAPTDRSYWEQRASKSTVALADEFLRIVKEIDPALELKYNKFYIGLSRSGQPYNFIALRPKKNQLNLELRLPRTDDIDLKIENAGMDALEYNTRYSSYRLRLTKSEVGEKSGVLRELIRLAYDRRAA